LHVGYGSGQSGFWSAFRSVGFSPTWSMESIPWGRHLSAVSSLASYRSGRVVCIAALGLMALDRGDDARNDRRPSCRCGPRRLRDKPSRSRPHGRGHRGRCRSVAGAGARARPCLRCVLVGGREPTGLGARLAHYVVRNLRKVKEQFTNFGAGGALVFGLLTWLVLALLLRETEPEAHDEHRQRSRRAAPPAPG